MSVLLSTADAAARLGITDSGVRQLIRAGRLTALRIGRAYVIEDAALAAVANRPRGWPKGKPRKPRASSESVD